jgi:hypothetical protein
MAGDRDPTVAFGESHVGARLACDFKTQAAQRLDNLRAGDVTGKLHDWTSTGSLTK